MSVPSQTTEYLMGLISYSSLYVGLRHTEENHLLDNILSFIMSYFIQPSSSSVCFMLMQTL